MLTTDLSFPTRLVLDTHIWVWHVEGEATKYAPFAREAIDAAARDGRLGVSAISIWEIAILQQKRALTLSTDLQTWVAESRRPPGVRVLPLSVDILIDGPRLPPWLRKGKRTPHKDPADRWIVATARHTNAVLMTCDTEILEYAEEGHVQVCDARP